MKLAFPVLALFLFAACGAGAASKVPGTYTLDAKAFAAQLTAAAPKGKDAAETDMAKKMIGEMAEKSQGSMELAADNTAKMKGEIMGKKIDGQGTWKVEGDKITLTTKEAGRDDSMTGKIQDGTITIEMPAMEGMTKPVQVVWRKK